MSDYVITCCSTVDMTEAFFKERDIAYLPFHFTMDGHEYLDDYGKSITIEDFYKAMENGAQPTTSQIGIMEYAAFFKTFVEKGLKVLHLTLSSGISGSYNSAVNAAKEINEAYGEEKVYVLDSLAASSGYGMLVTIAKDNLDKGMSIIDNYHYLEEHRLNIQHWFFTADLTYLIRGGRVSKAAGFVGTALHICPLLHVSYDGHLKAKEKIRGKKKVIMATVDKMEELALNGLDYDGYVYISNSACMDDALAVKEEIMSRFKKVRDVKIYSIGTVIGAHTGPGTVALFFVGKKRNEND